MRTVHIAGLEFNILEDKEPALITKNCRHEWQSAFKDVIVNPAAEYVEGYGNRQVAVRIAAGKRCQLCGLFLQKQELEPIVTDEFKAILKMRPNKNRTICQLLRELRNEVTDTGKVDACLQIAKKMDAKLVENVGRQYTRDWYDKNGNFVG